MRIRLRSKLWIICTGVMLLATIVGTSLYLNRPEERDRSQSAAGGMIIAVREDVAPDVGTSAADPADLPERPPPPEGVDASNLYKNAFVLWDKLTEEERQRILSKPHDGVYDEATEALFQKIQPIMALLHEAARADYCDWALGDVTPETRLLHLPRAQALAKLALWNAAHRLPTDPDGAVEDLFARAQLGRDLSETMVGYLVEISFEAGAATLLQRHGATLTPSALERAHELFSSPDLQPDISRAMQAEASLVKSFASSSPETRLEMMRKAMDAPEPGDAEGAARQRQVEEFLLDSERVTANAEFLTQVYGRLPEAMLWPRAQFDEWWKGIEADLPGRPLGQMILPSVTSMRNASDRSRVQRSMLSAGLAVLQHGPAELANYPDPYTSGAFVYSLGATGFELRSALQHKGQPLRMEFAVPSP